MDYDITLLSVHDGSIDRETIALSIWFDVTYACIHGNEYCSYWIEHTDDEYSTYYKATQGTINLMAWLWGDDIIQHNVFTELRETVKLDLDALIMTHPCGDDERVDPKNKFHRLIQLPLSVASLVTLVNEKHTNTTVI